MNRSLIKKLWKLGDKQFIDYALSCARLTLRERETVQYLLFDGLTQEQAAEKMDTRAVELCCGKNFVSSRHDPVHKQPLRN